METIDRTRQEIEKRDENPSAGVPSRTEEANLNGGLDNSPEQPTRPKSSNNPREKEKQHEGNVKRHASGNVVDNQVCIYLLCRAVFYINMDPLQRKCSLRILNFSHVRQSITRLDLLVRNCT